MGIIIWDVDKETGKQVGRVEIMSKKLEVKSYKKSRLVYASRLLVAYRDIHVAYHTSEINLAIEIKLFSLPLRSLPILRASLCQVRAFFQRWEYYSCPNSVFRIPHPLAFHIALHDIDAIPS